MGIHWAGVRYSVSDVETPNDRFVLQTAAGSCADDDLGHGNGDGGTDR